MQQTNFPSSEVTQNIFLKVLGTSANFAEVPKNPRKSHKFTFSNSILDTETLRETHCDTVV